MKSLRVVFMGTPEFAVPMLDVLCNSNHQIVGVVTAPDKPAGRGMQLSQSEVKKFAVAKNLHLLQPEKLKSEEFLADLKSLNADLFVVVAFRMLPEVVWRMPAMGTINLHASLLPQYRGAAPINWAVINGETETGVTTFFIQQEIDTGKIIFSDKVTINEDENAGDLYAKLMELGASVLAKTVDSIAEGVYPQIPQEHITDIKHAPKIFKQNCLIDWNKSVLQVHNLIRGLSPYPAAYTMLQGKVFKIYSSRKVQKPTTDSPGSFHTDGKTFLSFSCTDGYIDVVECQMEGKKRMSVEEFLRGFNSAK